MGKLFIELPSEAEPMTVIYRYKGQVYMSDIKWDEEPQDEDEPQTEPLTCRNKDHYDSCKYVDKCNPVVCFKALDELNDRLNESGQTDCAWK